MDAPAEAAPPSALRERMFRLAPGVAAGTSLGISDVLSKIVLASGCDVLTLLSFRSVIGLLFVASWFRFGQKPTADARVRWISMGTGILFTGLIYCLFKAIDVIDVPTAVLSYFTYPLLTGIAGSLLGIEPLRFKGLLCAVAAFLGLALMISAHPAGLAFAGVLYAIGAACCRAAGLLVTRVYLIGADARLSTWYSMISSTLAFLAASLVTQSWHPPQGAVGWVCAVAVSLATAAAILFVFLSTMRIGPFRTALIMNLEPFIAMVMSALLLGQVITPIQGLGSAVMLAALVAFQLLR